MFTVNVTGLDGPWAPVLNKALCSTATSTPFLSDPLLDPAGNFLLNLKL